MSDQPKRRGRPRLNIEGAARRNVTVQIGLVLYDSLVKASGTSGLSLSREIEARLAASFIASDIRQIVREEIAAARDGGSLLSPNALSGMKGAITTTYPLPADGPVQIHVEGRSARDWLRV